MESNDSGRQAESPRLWVFARLWAWSVLFSAFSTFYWIKTSAAESILWLGCIAACSAVIFCQRSIKLLTFALGLAAFTVIYEMPETPNHRHVLLFLSLLMLSPLVQHRRTPWALDDHFELVTIPCIRLLTIAVYEFAFLAKLNWDYIDPSVSCSVSFYNNIAGYLDFLPNIYAMRYLVIHGSLLIEAVLPVFLASRRTRPHAIAIGLTFHFFLGFDLIKYFTNFSAVMFCLLVSFLPAAGLEFLAAAPQRAVEFARSPRWLRSPRTWRIIIGAGIFSICIPGILSELIPHPYGRILWTFCATNRHVVWLAFATSIMIAAALYWKKSGYSALEAGRVHGHLTLAEFTVLLLVLLNGMAPYLGLKTRTSFNMYSNLRVEPEISNHFFITRSLDLGGFLTDFGMIRGSSKTVCNGNLLTGSPYPLVEISRRVQECPQENVRFSYRGEIYSSREERAQRLLEAQSSWLSRKFTIFKPMDLHAAYDCIW